jgi:hypothetical protein
MAENNSQVKDPQKNGNNRGFLGLLIAFIIILLAINIVQLFFNLKQNRQIETHTETIDKTNYKLDSLSRNLDIAIGDLERSKKELAALGGDTARLGVEIRQLIEDKKRLASSNYDWQKKYNDISDRIDAANRIREDATREVVRLKVLLAKQDTIIMTHKTTIVEREDSILKITSEKNQLAEKIALASILKAESFKIEALNAKGKADDDGEFKGKKIERIKVTFSLSENKIAEKGGREIIFRLIEPDGSALFDLGNGGGSFLFNGKELFYTMKQTILFENKGQRVSFEYRKGTPYKLGTNKVEIYCEGAKIGESTFVVN